MCGGRLQPVLDTLKTLKEQGVWFEIVVLLVTGRNDSADEVKRLAGWVAKNLSPDVPLHFSRYFPMYKLRLPPTPVDTMAKAYDAAKAEGLHFVYVGNIELAGKSRYYLSGVRPTAIKRLGSWSCQTASKTASAPNAAGRYPACGRRKTPSGAAS